MHEKGIEEMFCFRRKRKKVLVLWYTADDNLGDYFIYATVTSFLRDWGFDYLSMDVGLPYQDIARTAKKCDFVWFAGGGIIERGIPNIILYFEEFLKCSKRVKYGITGLSIGGFDYSYAKRPLSIWVNQSDFFYTRDMYSAYKLNEISDSTKAKPCVDVVFALNLEELKEANNTVYELGINFRELPYVDLSGEFQWEKWNDEIARIGRSIVGIPDQHDCSGKVKHTLEKDYTPQKALGIIEQCETVLAMRYHVLLFAARLGKIPIPIDYCPKVNRLAEQLNVSELVLGVHDYEKLGEVVNRVFSNKEYYENIIAEKVRNYEYEARRMFQNIEDHMKKEILQ